VTGQLTDVEKETKLCDVRTSLLVNDECDGEPFMATLYCFFLLSSAYRRHLRLINVFKCGVERRQELTCRVNPFKAKRISLAYLDILWQGSPNSAADNPAAGLCPTVV